MSSSDANKALHGFGVYQTAAVATSKNSNTTAALVRQTLERDNNISSSLAMSTTTTTPDLNNGGVVNTNMPKLRPLSITKRFDFDGYHHHGEIGASSSEDAMDKSSPNSSSNNKTNNKPHTPLGKVVESGHEQTGRWTREEHASFLSALQLYGKEWKKVAAKVKTRTVVQTRTHAQKYFQKLQKGMVTGEKIDLNGIEMSTVAEAKKATPTSSLKKKSLQIRKTTSLLAPIMSSQQQQQQHQQQHQQQQQQQQHQQQQQQQQQQQRQQQQQEEPTQQEQQRQGPVD